MKTDTTLINANVLAQELQTSLKFMRYDGSRLGTDDFLIRQSDVLRLIADQQAVNAVPVVRCRACDAWDRGLCRLLCADTEEDGFCHRARQKGALNEEVCEA